MTVIDHPSRATELFDTEAMSAETWAWASRVEAATCSCSLTAK